MALYSTVLEYGAACTKVLRQEEVYQVHRTEWSPQQIAKGGKRYKMRWERKMGSRIHNALYTG